MSRVMLITGASSGIGRAVAKQAAADDFKLILTARRENLLNELVEEIGSDKAWALAADASSYDEVGKVIEQGVKHWGSLDVAFANAGVGINTPGTEKGDPKEWEQMLAININGLLWTAKHSLPHLREKKGHFIITSSMAGRSYHSGSIYSSSKWFAYGFGLNLAQEMSEWNGRCTTICPGMVNTPFFNDPKPDKLHPDDVADAVMHAVNANPRNNIREIFLMPTF
ncbi:MAG: SDR family oxidoreductase [Pseudobacteriovorax sp.]|nr:SDR family oxidoreductase [Pseudobacteriovorax sp.]